MKKEFSQITTLVPEFLSLFHLRYRILQMVSVSGPIGRRTVVDLMKVSERIVRNEMETLKNQQLIEITQKGMICTSKGNEILDELKEVFQELSGLAQKEKALAKLLNIKKTIIVPGNLEEDENIKQLIGKEAATLLTKYSETGDFVAVTGGSTVASIANFLAPVKSLSSLTFIAARGSIGDELELQANTLVSQFGTRTNANFKTLYLPENLSKAAYKTMIQEPVIKEIIELYDQVDCVLHGIGNAKEMAERRHSDSEVITHLKSHGAVGEAFGYYFDETGQIIHSVNTIGIHIEQVMNSKNIVAVAGGVSKAKAIRAYFQNAASHTVLITDEGAADAMLGDSKEVIL